MRPASPHRSDITVSPSVDTDSSASTASRNQTYSVIQVIFSKFSDAWNSFKNFFIDIFQRMHGHKDRARENVDQRTNFAAENTAIDLATNIRDGSAGSVDTLSTKKASDNQKAFETCRDFLWMKIDQTKDVPIGQAAYPEGVREHAKIIIENHVAPAEGAEWEENQLRDYVVALLISGKEAESKEIIKNHFHPTEKANSSVVEDEWDDFVGPEISHEANGVTVDGQAFAKVENEQRDKTLFNELVREFYGKAIPTTNAALMRYYESACINYAKKYKEELSQPHRFDSKECQVAGHLLTKYDAFQALLKAKEKQIQSQGAAAKKSEPLTKEEAAQRRDHFFEERKKEQDIFDADLSRYINKFSKEKNKFLNIEEQNFFKQNLKYGKEGPALNLEKLASGLKLIADIETSYDPDQGYASSLSDGVSALSDPEKRASLREVQCLLERMSLENSHIGTVSENPIFRQKILGPDVAAISGVDSRFYLSSSDKFIDLLRRLFNARDQIAVRLARLDLSEPATEPAAHPDSMGLQSSIPSQLGSVSDAPGPETPASTMSTNPVAAPPPLPPLPKAGLGQVPQMPSRLRGPDRERAQEQLMNALGLKMLLKEFTDTIFTPADQYFFCVNQGKINEVNPECRATAFALALNWAAKKDISALKEWSESEIATLDFLLNDERIENDFADAASMKKT